MKPAFSLPKSYLRIEFMTGAYFWLLALFLILTMPKYAQGAFFLVDARTDQDIRELHEFDVLILSELPAEISIRIEPRWSSNYARSMVIRLNGEKIRTENVKPFSLGGDAEGNYKAFRFPTGRVRLSTVTYNERKGQGFELSWDRISFTVLDYPVENRPPSLEVDLDPEEIFCNGGPIHIPLIGTDPDGDKLSYKVELYDIRSEWDPHVLPPFLEVDEQQGLISGVLTNNMSSSSYFTFYAVVEDELGFFDKELVSVFQHQCSDFPESIEGLYLIDASTGEDLKSLDWVVDEDTGDPVTWEIDLAEYPQPLSIRAVPDPNFLPHLGSVSFRIWSWPDPYFPPEIPTVRVENVAPYTLGGDVKGRINPLPFKPGSFSIRVNGFEKANAKGPLDIGWIDIPLRFIDSRLGSELEVRHETAVQTIDPACIRAFPNPFQDNLFLELGNSPEQRLEVSLFDALGKRVLSWEEGYAAASTWRLPTQNLLPGYYTLQVLDPQGKIICQIPLVKAK